MRCMQEVMVMGGMHEEMMVIGWITYRNKERSVGYIAGEGEGWKHTQTGESHGRR